MKTYIASKIVKGEPMQEHEFALKFGKPDSTINIDRHGNSRAGYHVLYPDDYNSWSPSEAFENSHREILPGEMSMLVSAGQVT